MGYVPPPGPKSKSLYLVGSPHSIFVNSRLLEGRGPWGELLCQVARSEGKQAPSPTDLEGSKYLTDRSQKATDHSTNQRVPLQMKERGVQRARSLFPVSCLPGFPSWVSGEKPQSTFSRPTSFSMKLLSEPTLLALDRKEPGSHSPPSG